MALEPESKVLTLLVSGLAPDAVLWPLSLQALEWGFAGSVTHNLFVFSSLRFSSKPLSQGTALSPAPSVPNEIVCPAKCRDSYTLWLWNFVHLPVTLLD